MIRQLLGAAPIFALALGLAACQSDTFDGPRKLGGVWVSAETLNLGHDTYMNHCMQCHGVNGDGLGPAAQGMNPQPRNFKQGLIKFGSVTSGELPTDDDLKHTIRYGLKGTPMLPWDISDDRLNAVVQYIKTFSDVWEKQAPGKPQETTPDPWGVAKRAEAIALGKKVYHGMAQCYTCHPSYASSSEINAATKELTGNDAAPLRDGSHLSIPQDSSYGHKFVPPDFTKSSIKSGGDVASLYKVLGTGVGGTSMPAWKDMLDPNGDKVESERRLWALAYYVRSLYELRYDLKQRDAFFAALNANRPVRQ